MTTAVLAYLPSPSQGVWHLGPVPIRAYALCIIGGIVAALVIGDRRWAARGGEPGVIYDIALWAVPFGLVGGRLYHVMTDWRTYFGPEGKGLAAAFQVWEGGLGIWGAVALGGVGAWIACRRRGIPLPAFADAIAPGIVLAQAIGRFGNYFNQELYGRATTLPWGLEIYDRRNAAGLPDQLNGVSNGTVLAVVHPTFLYELLWNLLIFALLIWADRRFRIGHGRLFALYVAGYCVGRFWVELMRSDAATHLAGIRINTFTSTFVFIGAVVYIMLAPKGREDPATLSGHRRGDTAETVIDEFGKEVIGVAATTGVVAAAKAAGDSDTVDDVSDEHSEDMHPDAVTEDDGADAAAAVELKAIVPQTDTAEDAPAEDAAEGAEPEEESPEAASEELEAEDAVVAEDEDVAVTEQGEQEAEAEDDETEADTTAEEGSVAEVATEEPETDESAESASEKAESAELAANTEQPESEPAAEEPEPVDEAAETDEQSVDEDTADSEGTESEVAEDDSADSEPTEVDEPAEPAEAEVKDEASEDAAAVPSPPAASAPEHRRWWRRRR
ncbi:prolipoprotein diacylglyceryl transferase [Mycobacterium sp. 155]|uniref:prolipoprotein diacylglyceryl transferase n=1 Tax=Mycobacterium sp. 155 TaxID=1157943 RepID=UPI00036FBD08|nr:prolipoprotein diacylglyceryl transferase [Mycobacterium sp. 155]